MKVLFINPSRAGQGNIPLNIPLLISVLKNKGHRVELFDFTNYQKFNDKEYENIYFKRPEFIDRKQIYKERKKFYKGRDLKDKLINSDYNKDFENLINKFKPDILAVSCLSMDYKFCSEWLLKYKKQFNIPIIFGGIKARLTPLEVIKNDIVDYICTGEGEKTFPNLLNTLENNLSLNNVKGIWYKKNGKILKNEPEKLTDVNNLPPPDYSLFDPIHFYRPFDGIKYKMINYEFSRGCPFNCSYCINGIFKVKYKGLGKYCRHRNVKKSINELKYLVDMYKFNFVRFWDSDFTAVSEKLLEEYAELYIKKIKLPFLIYSRVESITENKVKILKEMGCKTFAMGLESGSEYIRKNVLNRKMSNEYIIKKFRIVQKYGIRVSAYNMIGLPKETKKDIFKTIELNKIINPDSFSVSLLEPYEGTPIRELCEQEGLSKNIEVDGALKEPIFIPKSITKTELNNIYKTFHFYVRFPKKNIMKLKRVILIKKITISYRKNMKKINKGKFIKNIFESKTKL